MGTHLGGLWQKRRSSMTYATQRSLGLDPFQMQLPMNVQADMANRVGTASSMSPAPSFASLVHQLPVLSIPGGTTQRLAEIVIDRARTPIYRVGVLLTMLTGDRRYANDSSTIPRRWLPCARLSHSLGLPDEFVGRLATAPNSSAFEAAARPILQEFVRRANIARSVGPSWGGSLSNPSLVRARPQALSGTMDGAGGTILIGGVLLVAAGVAIYFAVNHAKEERVLRARIVEKDGAAGLAQYEDAKTKRAAVQGGLGILSGLAWGGDNRRMRRNKSRSRKRKTSKR